MFKARSFHRLIQPTTTARQQQEECHGHTYQCSQQLLYFPDGKNSRLMNIVDRREFKWKTVDGNEGFVLQIPFLEHALAPNTLL